MNDKMCLDLLSEIVTNTKRATHQQPSKFFTTYIDFGVDINRVSRHLDNKNLRKVYFHISSLEAPLREGLNYELQSTLCDAIDDTSLTREVMSGLEEIILNASQSVTVYVVSNRREHTIDMRRLREDIENHIDNLGEEAASAVLFSITETLRDVYEDFVSQYSEELIAFYEEIEDSCQQDWDSVLRSISSKTIDMDNRAIHWRRTQV
jgi:hypothetical protein